MTVEQQGVRCLECGYDLYKTAGPCCPECGSPVRPSVRAWRRTQLKLRYAGKPCWINAALLATPYVWIGGLYFLEALIRIDRSHLLSASIRQVQHAWFGLGFVIAMPLWMFGAPLSMPDARRFRDGGLYRRWPRWLAMAPPAALFLYVMFA